MTFSELFRHFRYTLKYDKAIRTEKHEVQYTIHIDEVKKRIQRFLHHDYEVIIAGWSHGGALSFIAVEDINFRTRSNKNDPDTGLKPIVLTYGAPRVFSDDASIEYVRSCVKLFVEISNYNDITCRVPFGYRRTSTCGCIGDKFNFFKLFNPFKYHSNYEEEETYRNIGEAGISFEI